MVKNHKLSKFHFILFFIVILYLTACDKQKQNTTQEIIQSSVEDSVLGVTNSNKKSI